MIDTIKKCLGIGNANGCDEETFISTCNDVIAGKKGSINRLVGLIERYDTPSKDAMIRAEEVLRFSITEQCNDNHLKTVLKPWVQTHIAKYGIPSITD